MVWCMFPCHFNINFSVCLMLTKHAELSLNTRGIFSHSAPPARLPHSLHPHAHHQWRSSASGCLKQIAESKDLFLYAIFFFTATFYDFFFFLPCRAAPPSHWTQSCQNVRAAPALHWEHDMTESTVTRTESREKFFFSLERAWKQHHSRFTLFCFLFF